MIQSITITICTLIILFSYFFVYELIYDKKHPKLQKPKKKTYMFENEKGQKINPFKQITEGAKNKKEKEYKYTLDRFK